MNNPGSSLNESTTRTVTSPGTYTATAEVCGGDEEAEEDEEGAGCCATYTVTFEVTEILEVPCGKNGEKIAICHKGKTICISRSALDAHIAHGDAEVPCN